MCSRPAAAVKFRDPSKAASSLREALTGSGTKNWVLGASVREDVVLLDVVLAVAVAALAPTASAPAKAVAPAPERAHRIQ